MYGKVHTYVRSRRDEVNNIGAGRTFPWANPPSFFFYSLSIADARKRFLRSLWLPTYIKTYLSINADGTTYLHNYSFDLEKNNQVNIVIS